MALMLMAIPISQPARAAQFSFQCDHLHDQSGIREFFTFDDEKMRVIGYGLAGKDIVNAIFRGPIISISPDIIRFELTVAFDKIKVGEFTLNRQEGWMSPSQSPEEGATKDSCKPTATRSPLDLWRVFDRDQ
jgi:hypothetical protein